MARIRIANDGSTVESSSAVSILNAFLREGIGIRHDCGGKALCGTCRLRVISGAAGLSPILPREAERLAAILSGDGSRSTEAREGGSLRLACQAHVSREVEVEILLTRAGDGKPS